MSTERAEHSEHVDERNGNDPNAGAFQPDIVVAPVVKLSAKDQRMIEKRARETECQARLASLLEELECDILPIQEMKLGPNGGPIYSYQLRIVAR